MTETIAYDGLTVTARAYMLDEPCEITIDGAGVASDKREDKASCIILSIHTPHCQNELRHIKVKTLTVILHCRHSPQKEVDDKSLLSKYFFRYAPGEILKYDL